MLQILFGIAGSLCLAWIPLIEKEFFDVFNSSTAKYLGLLITLYVVLNFCNVIFNYLTMIFTWKGAVKFEYLMKEDFFSSIFKQKYSDFKSRDIGEYVSMQGNDLTAIEQDYLQPMIDLIHSFCKIIIYAVVIFKYLDYRIACVIVLVSVLAVFCPKILGDKLSEKRLLYQNEMAKYTSKITDLMEGFELINDASRENFNKEHAIKLLNVKNKRYEFGKMKSLTLSLNDLALKSIKIATILLSIYLLYKNYITIGTVVAALGYADSFIEPIDSFLYDINAIKSVDKVKENFISIVNKNIENITQSRKEINEIKLKNVEIACGDCALHNLNMILKKGEKYAIVGKSGSGKSTFAKTIAGYMGYTKGDISINGEDIKYFSENISYENQDEHIFTMSASDNIGVLGTYDITKVLEIVQKINDDNIDRVVHYKDSCAKLSGGEKQIIKFMRKIAENRQVIILDEPFSAMDIKSKKIFEEILFSKYFDDKILIVITHDQTKENLKKYDNVYRVSDGSMFKEAV